MKAVGHSITFDRGATRSKPGPVRFNVISSPNAYLAFLAAIEPRKKEHHGIRPLQTTKALAGSGPSDAIAELSTDASPRADGQPRHPRQVSLAGDRRPRLGRSSSGRELRWARTRTCRVGGCSRRDGSRVFAVSVFGDDLGCNPFGPGC